jgi:hypothetical protein
LFDTVGLGDRLNDITQDYGCASLRLETWTFSVEAVRILKPIGLHQTQVN